MYNIQIISSIVVIQPDSTEYAYMQIVYIMFTCICIYLIYTNTHTYICIYVEKENKRRGEEARGGRVG